VLKNKVDIISLEVSSAKVLLSYHHLLPLQSHTINWCYLALEWVKKKTDCKACLCASNTHGNTYACKLKDLEAIHQFNLLKTSEQYRRLSALKMEQW